MSLPLAVLALALATFSMATLFWSRHRLWVSPALVLTWVIHIVFWSFIPGVYYLAYGVDSLPTEAAAWGWLAVLQAALTLALVLAHLGMRRPAILGVPEFFDEHAISPTGIRHLAVAGFIILATVEVAVNRIAGASFGEATAFSVTASSAELAKVGLLETALTFLVAFGIAIISLGRSYGLTRATVAIGYGMIIVHSSFAMLRGIRSVVLLPVIAGLIGLTTLVGRDRRRAATALALLATVTIAIGAPVAAALGVLRGFASSTLSLETVRAGLESAVTGTPLSSQIDFIASEVNRKFDAVGPGVELLKLEPPNSGGAQPLVSAMLSPIPRVLFPDKPVPTSRDGTYLGTPYRIAAKAYGDPEAGMVVPVTASAISIWEFGWLGVVLLFVANFANLIAINSCLLTKNVVVRAFGISLLGLPTAEFFVAPTSSIVRDLLRLGVMLATVAVAFIAWRRLLVQRAAHEPSPL